MDDIRVTRPHNYQPSAPGRPAVHSGQSYSQPVQPAADETQTVSISIGLPQISLRGKKRAIILLVIAAVAAIFLIGYAAGRYSMRTKVTPAMAPTSSLKHEA
jgi:hypothetical protein